jgi:hypothetical protein
VGSLLQQQLLQQLPTVRWRWDIGSCAGSTSSMCAARQRVKQQQLQLQPQPFMPARHYIGWLRMVGRLLARCDD